MTKDLNRHFTKEDVRMATKHVKRHPASLVIRKMQIHTTAKYQLIHPHWNDCHKKRQTIQGAGRDAEQLEHL